MDSPLDASRRADLAVLREAADHLRTLPGETCLDLGARGLRALANLLHADLGEAPLVEVADLAIILNTWIEDVDRLKMPVSRNILTLAVACHPEMGE